MTDRMSHRPRPLRRLLQTACLVTPLLTAGCGAPFAGGGATKPMEWVVVAPDQRSFRLQPSGRGFVPWGFNYDHDETGRLLEDYWQDEWPKVEQDFQEMRDLGANVVRIHLQLGRFMDAPSRPNGAALARLVRLVRLAERLGLYLDITGLGCYHKKDVPAWYDRLDEAHRWAVQVRFWEAIARRCADSPAVFCYDLMNEPVVPGGRGKRDDWLGPAFAGKHFVQFIALSTAGRERPEIALRWIRTLKAAIRRRDGRHLITVGLVDWSLDRPGLTSGFVPARIVGELDFLCTHIYPRAGKLHDATETLRGFGVGKPVVVEETFPLRCGIQDLAAFIDGSQDLAAGWVGFYWGRTPAELRKGGTIPDAMMLQWLEFFQQRAGPPRAP